MTWPFENDTSTVLRKLAVNSTKSDKRSRLFLLLTIALSVCMVFSILLISIGTQEAYKNTQRNKAQIAVLGVTDQQSSLLSENPDVLWVGEYSQLTICCCWMLRCQTEPALIFAKRCVLVPRFQLFF